MMIELIYKLKCGSQSIGKFKNWLPWNEKETENKEPRNVNQLD